MLSSCAGWGWAASGQTSAWTVSNGRKPGSQLQRGQPFLQIMRHERFDEAVNVAVDDRGQIVKRQFDAVVGHTVLRKVVGADALVAFACADLGLALRGVFRVFFGDLLLEQSRAQYGERLLFVLLL